ncbi:uncharacterized protein LOC143596689 [Bidens hawaiensis]|uniref:uncharacterized protein LOC143596689 n=1 Tax=Bidens hawaiensis TaxID=980011 RepID=UPI00404B9F57
MELPTLTAPREGEPLILYLSASDIAIGAVLLTDRKTIQTPIYYVSRTLADAETRYSMLEKLVLALVYAAHRLKREGSDAGRKLINPDGQEFTYAIKLNFKSTNNEAEYEAFLVGLRIAKKLGVKFLEARVDSMLVAGQVSRTYEAKNDVMASYLSQAKDLMQQFTSCKVVHNKRSENRPADALSKLASTSFEHMGRDVKIEVLDAPSVPRYQVLVIQTGTTSWMEPIRAYLSSGTLPEDKAEARKIRHKSLCYQVHNRILLRKSFLGPLLRCVDAEDTNYVIREIHEGICGLHAGQRMIVAKVMTQGTTGQACIWAHSK